MIADLAGLKVRPAETDGVVRIEDDRWNGYLANISPKEFDRDFAPHVPKQILGDAFLARYHGITDTVTRVLPDKTYAVLDPTRHPVYENARVRRFAELLTSRLSNETLIKLGELMYGSHESYSVCGLGTKETDLLVNLVKDSEKLFGAKITGGGSGGTVAVLGLNDAEADIAWVAEKYEAETGYHPYIFSGSSIGAANFGHFRVRL